MECVNQCLANILGPLDAASAAGATPIPKSALKVPTVPGSSPVTNPVSSAGHHLTKNWPGKGKIGTQILGTNRWAGLLGRLNIALFTGLMSYNVTTCEIQCNNSCGD
jgi:hypothetical protein